MAFTFEQGFIWCEMCGLTLWMTCPWFWVCGPNFPDLPQCPKYTKTGVNQPSNGICIRVRPHSMWNVEFNNLNDFLCIDAHDLGHLGPISLTCLSSSKNTNTGITRLSVGLYPWVRFHLMWSVEFNTLDEFLCIHALYLGFSLDLPQCPNILKQI